MFGIDLGRGGRPLRIAYGRIFHEACAYSPSLTSREQVVALHRLEGEALARAASLSGSEIAGYMPHAELSGFVQAARLAGGVETVPLASTLTIPSGPMERSAFEWLLDDLVGRVREAGRLDGIYLALHGSMQVEGLNEAPEAVILRRVREAVRGADVKLAASFDLHGNLSPGIVEPLDVLIAYRTNPHWDLAPTGFRAGNRLSRALRHGRRASHAWRKLPMVLGGGMTIDFLPPMRSIFRRMAKMERDPRVLSASLFMVHPYTSADDLGWAVHVSTDGEPALAERLADELADLAWSVRHEELPPMRTVDEALDEAASSPWRKLGPVTLVDVDDIVGAGAPGGNTHIVQALAKNDRGLAAFVPLHDPGAVDAAWSAEVGARRELVLRGTPGYGQPEVALDATIGWKGTTDFGRTVRFDFGGVRVVAAERAPLPIHPKLWREVGLRARDADVIVQKNFFHYRIFYAATSFQHIPVISAGATSLTRVREREYRVPTHPGRDPGDWRRWDPVLRGLGNERSAAAE
jgi:microcystin degradation protein MlrC